MNKLRKMLICLISICDLTREFIGFQRRSEDKRMSNSIQGPNDLIFRHIMQFGSNEDKLKIKKNQKLLKLPLLALMDKFDIQMFQNFIFIAGVRFEGSYSDQRVLVLEKNMSRFISVPHPLKIELFITKKKRKDDMMSSLLKFNQRHILGLFKKDKSFKLIRTVKQDFRREYFSHDKETEKIYYSNLFNRRQLEMLGTNKKLLEQMKSCYDPSILPKLFHEYFMKAKPIPILDLKTKKLFSTEFLKFLQKKHMNLGDALFSFYRIEDYIFKSHREYLNSQ
jgi:hypothetical protein